MSLSDEDIESIIEDQKTETKLSDFPLDIEIEYFYADEEEVKMRIVEDGGGYVIKIYSYVNNEKYGNEVVIPEDTDEHTFRGILRISIDKLKEQLWDDFVVES